MAFYDTYGDSKNRRIAQQAQNNQAFQAFANFMQQGQQNNAENAYRRGALGIQQQELDQNAPYKQAMAQQATAQANLYQQRANGTGLNTIPQDDQIVVGQYANGQPIIKSKKAMQQMAEMQMEVQRKKDVQRIKSRKLTGEENKALGYADVLNKDLDYLKNKIGTSDEWQGYMPFGAFQSGGQSFKDSLNSVSNLLLYLRSGAQINEQEYKRLKQNLPSLTGKDDVDKRKIERFQAEFAGIKDRIKYGTLSEGDRALLDEDSGNGSSSSYKSLWS